ncbi:MAG: hypothetical protein ABSA33_02350 [Candidatus Micrarchaeaceae archaeon]
MTKMTVNPGVCGFVCLIEAERKSPRIAMKSCRHMAQRTEKRITAGMPAIQRGARGKIKE